MISIAVHHTRREFLKTMGLGSMALALPVWALADTATAADTIPASVGTFKQEVGVVYTQANGLPSDDVSSVAITITGDIYAGTSGGLARWGAKGWLAVDGLPPGPVYRLHAQEDRVLAALEGGVYAVGPGTAEKIANLPPGAVHDLAAVGGGIYAATDGGLHILSGRRWKLDKQLSEQLGGSKAVHAVASGPGGALVVGTAGGLFRREGNGPWIPLNPRSRDGRSWALRDVWGVAFDSRGRLWFASPQGAGRYDGEWALFTGQEGLPYNDFTCLRPGEEGVVWFGTRIGAIRFDGASWDYRQGRRWLPDDVVHDIAVTSEGHAWLATGGGVGLIERRPMTLAEKAAFYEQEIERHLKRTEWGYVSEVRLKAPGDKSAVVRTDSDNDGLWTSMYGAGECFAYAATKDPEAKRRAKRAFEALRFLSTVTQGGQVRQQPGFVARTVVPTSEPDPNQRSGYTLEGMKQRRQTRDSHWKVYYPRWPLSGDGKYWYKTDTSSDELDGHYFFYTLYYDLVTETEAEKEQVRQLVRAITDHLIRNDFALIDHDGTPTRWAVYRPSLLNNDPQWFPERGLNSLSILSYLAAAEYITGDPKYGEASRRLQQEHAYNTNAMVAKLQRGVGSGNQSDDEMAFMNYYTLIRYTRDEALRRQMLLSFYNYWVLEYPEMNPFFNFAYAACARDARFTDAWGSYDLAPWDGWLDDGVATLTGFPLDRINWAHENSHRLDIAPLPRQASTNFFAPPGRTRGCRASGKVLPVQERHFSHWNHDPWWLDTGGDGRGLASGAVFLLPYYMGLYHGFLK